MAPSQERVEHAPDRRACKTHGGQLVVEGEGRIELAVTDRSSGQVCPQRGRIDHGQICLWNRREECVGDQGPHLAVAVPAVEPHHARSGQDLVTLGAELSLIAPDDPPRSQHIFAMPGEHGVDHDLAARSTGAAKALTVPGVAEDLVTDHGRCGHVVGHHALAPAVDLERDTPHRHTTRAGLDHGDPIDLVAEAAV